MFKLTRKTFYIILFSILWLITAFSSFFHAVEFFELSNVTWMGIILAMAFEIGQASVLMSILTSKQDRKKYTPWILMCILTLVQIIGNVYSSYKYIMLNSSENLKYFKEPIFIWTQLPDAEATVIITYVSAAILPIVALLMTSMITNYLSDQEELKKEQLEEKHIEEITNEIEDKNEDNPQEDPEKHNEDIDIPEKEAQLDEKEFDEFNKDAENIVFKEKNEEIDKLKKEIEDLKNPKIHQIPATEIHEPISFSESEGLKQLKEESNIDTAIKGDENTEEPDEDPEKVNLEPSKESHFINLK